MPHTDKLRIWVVFLGSVRGILSEMTIKRDFSLRWQAKWSNVLSGFIFGRLNFIQGVLKPTQIDIPSWWNWWLRRKGWITITLKRRKRFEDLFFEIFGFYETCGFLEAINFCLETSGVFLVESDKVKKRMQVWRDDLINFLLGNNSK